MIMRVPVHTTLSVVDEQHAIVRLVFRNVGDDIELLDRRMACMNGFVPKGAFRLSAPRRFIGRRVTSFGADAEFYEAIAPGQQRAIEIRLALEFEWRGELIDVHYQASHANADASRILALASETVRIRL